MVGSANPGLYNFGDMVYATNITVGGQNFLIQLDTGSSDLWLMDTGAPIQFSNTTDIVVGDEFGIGGINGTIQFANVSLGSHFVPDQAILNVTTATDFGLIFGDGIAGILGLAFDYESNVDLELLLQWGPNQTLGRSFMSNLFAQDPSSPNLITFQLGRAEDPEANPEGVFTIGEIDGQFANIMNEPQLQRYPNYKNLSEPPRWSVVMDGMTINGEPFAFNTSGVPGVPAGSQVAILDTGYTFPPIPPAAVDAIYSSINGAYFDESSGLWITPCENSTSLEFQFGGQSYPVHPLDITIPTEINGTIYCVSTFRPSTTPINDQFDLILGVAFLKNVYTSFNYGDWNPNNNTGIPFVQLLSTTNINDAWAEFNLTRTQQVVSAEATATPVSSTVTPTTTPTMVTSSAPTVTTLAQRSFVRRSSEPERRASGTRAHKKRAPDCLTPMLEAYGAFMVAVVVGAAMMFVMCCAVGLALLVRSISRSQTRASAAYMVVDAKAEASADPEALLREATLRSYHDY